MARPLKSVLFFALVLLLYGPVHAKSECHEKYAKLNQVIENNFSFGANIVPAGKVEIPELERNEVSLKLARKLWKKSRPDKEFRRRVIEASVKGEVSNGLKSRSDALRSHTKMARFICQLLCRDPKEIKTLDDLTIVLGHLEDAHRFGSKSEISDYAKQLDPLLSEGALEKIDEEMEKMVALDKAGLTDRVNGMISHIESSIGRSDLTVDDFHEVRKEVGRLQVLVLLNGVHTEDPSEETTFELVRGLYEEIGKDHDTMEKAYLAGDPPKTVAFSPEEQAKISKAMEYFKQAPNPQNQP
jgi:hypothetical protein